MSIFHFRFSLIDKLDRLNITPLTIWCIFYCLGIIFESHLKVSFILLSVFLCIFIFLGLLFRKARIQSQLFLFCTIFLLGALTLSNSATLPASSIARLTQTRKEAVTLRGVIVSDPVVSKGKISFILEARQLSTSGGGTETCGRVLVKAGSLSEGFSYGDEIVVGGNLYKPFDFSSQTKGGYANFLNSKGIYSILSIANNASIKRMARGRAGLFKSFALFLKHKMHSVLSTHLTPFSVSILDAMLLGDGGGVEPSVRDMMIKTGTWHVMVVSGSNTALVAFILLISLKIFRIPKVARYGMTICLLVLYCLATGASSPVLRATVMTIVLLSSYLVGRNPLFYNSLALAALVILSFDPQSLFNVGFQLSFLSVFFIVWLYPKINKFITDRIDTGESHEERESFFKILLSSRPGSVLVSCFAVSLSAWIGTAPLIAYMFGNFSPITVFANMAVVPLAMFVVCSGFAFVIIGALLPPFAYFMAIAIEFLLSLFLKVNFVFVKVPWACISVGQIPFIAVLIYYCLIFTIFNLRIPRSLSAESSLSYQKTT